MSASSFGTGESGAREANTVQAPRSHTRQLMGPAYRAPPTGFRPFPDRRPTSADSPAVRSCSAQPLPPGTGSGRFAGMGWYRIPPATASGRGTSIKQAATPARNRFRAGQFHQAENHLRPQSLPGGKTPPAAPPVRRCGISRETTRARNWFRAPHIISMETTPAHNPSRAGPRRPEPPHAAIPSNKTGGKGHQCEIGAGAVATGALAKAGEGRMHRWGVLLRGPVHPKMHRPSK